MTSVISCGSNISIGGRSHANGGVITANFLEENFVIIIKMYGIASLGTQGVGKSMILNLIAQNTHTQDLCGHILQSHEIPTDNSYDLNDIATIENQMETLDLGDTAKTQEKAEIDFKFKMQDIEQIERGIHCTKGDNY